ncbi:MAG: flavin reductase family protein [Chloroherpetonaceae bacterium]|nr:flavin reductase family protein [Chloroherpetonaceae bacterium]MDW8438665.1 flavin reductase family protein [Chloroherpetonaceae bacterium]
MKRELNPSETNSIDLYKILVSAVMPRPIAWVSTTSKDGVDNLAPFSFFNAVSVKPPILAFAPALKEHNGKPTEKDTLRNIRETGEFVVNVVSRDLVEKMNQTSFDYAPDESEFDAVGLTREPSRLVKPKRVAESPINFECRLYQIIDFGREVQSGSLILGEIVMTHLDERVFKNGKIDMAELNPVGRLGGLWYCGIGDRFELKRPAKKRENAE